MIEEVGAREDRAGGQPERPAVLGLLGKGLPGGAGRGDSKFRGTSLRGMGQSAAGDGAALTSARAWMGRDATPPRAEGALHPSKARTWAPHGTRGHLEDRRISSNTYKFS